MNTLISKRVISTGVLGTTVKFDLVYDAVPTSVAISIYDPVKYEKVNDTAMVVGSSTKNYTYTYVSLTTNISGEYYAEIEAVFSDGTVHDVIEFDLQDYQLE